MARCNCANPNGLDSPLVSGCGLTGDGTPARPLTAAVGTWGYPGPVSTAGGVYCIEGLLRSDPEVYQRTAAASFSQTINRSLTGTLVTLSSLSAPITNPDLNRTAYGFAVETVWIKCLVPAAGIIQFFIDTKEVIGRTNTGSTTDNLGSYTYTQVTPFDVAPGATLPGTSSLRGAGTTGTVAGTVRHNLNLFMWTNRI